MSKRKQTFQRPLRVDSDAMGESSVQNILMTQPSINSTYTNNNNHINEFSNNEIEFDNGLDLSKSIVGESTKDKILKRKCMSLSPIEHRTLSPSMDRNGANHIFQESNERRSSCNNLYANEVLRDSPISQISLTEPISSLSPNNNHTQYPHKMGKESSAPKSFEKHDKKNLNCASGVPDDENNLIKKFFMKDALDKVKSANRSNLVASLNTKKFLNPKPNNGNVISMLNGGNHYLPPTEPIAEPPHNNNTKYGCNMCFQTSTAVDLNHTFNNYDSAIRHVVLEHPKVSDILSHIIVLEPGFGQNTLNTIKPSTSIQTIPKAEHEGFRSSRSTFSPTSSLSSGGSKAASTMHPQISSDMFPHYFANYLPYELFYKQYNQQQHPKIPSIKLDQDLLNKDTSKERLVSPASVIVSPLKANPSPPVNTEMKSFIESEKKKVPHHEVHHNFKSEFISNGIDEAENCFTPQALPNGEYFVMEEDGDSSDPEKEDDNDLDDPYEKGQLDAPHENGEQMISVEGACDNTPTSKTGDGFFDPRAVPYRTPGPKKFVCVYCHNTYSSRGNVNRHIRNTHFKLKRGTNGSIKNNHSPQSLDLPPKLMKQIIASGCLERDELPEILGKNPKTTFSPNHQFSTQSPPAIPLPLVSGKSRNCSNHSGGVSSIPPFVLPYKCEDLPSFKEAANGYIPVGGDGDPTQRLKKQKYLTQSKDHGPKSDSKNLPPTSLNNNKESHNDNVSKGEEAIKTKEMTIHKDAKYRSSPKITEMKITNNDSVPDPFKNFLPPAFYFQSPHYFMDEYYKQYYQHQLQLQSLMMTNGTKNLLQRTDSVESTQPGGHMDPTNQWICTICGTTFSLKHSLIRHHKRHAARSPNDPHNFSPIEDMLAYSANYFAANFKGGSNNNSFTKFDIMSPNVNGNGMLIQN